MQSRYLHSDRCVPRASELPRRPLTMTAHDMVDSLLGEGTRRADRQVKQAGVTTLLLATSLCLRLVVCRRWLQTNGNGKRERRRINGFDATHLTFRSISVKWRHKSLTLEADNALKLEYSPRMIDESRR
ncbi:hypothetical protein LSAT2_032057 [Lamellibrachia satsuma]|nr:hypothetical protein LSAT2_032057 [Lamellibrachia satsuma]